MNDVTRSRLRTILQQRRTIILDALYQNIRHTSFAPGHTSELRVQLSAALDHLIPLLLAEPFDPHPAQAIGRTLARLHYLQPESIRRTHTILAHQLVIGLDPDDMAALYPRLTAVLGSLVLGFSTQMQETILAEQEQIRQAVIAEQVRLRAALWEQEERLRLVVTNLPVVLFALDRAGIFLLAEGKGLELLGFTPHSLVGRSILTVSDANPQILKNIHRALLGNSFTTLVEVRDDVRDLVFETHYAPLRDAKGTIQGVLGVAIDVTARIRAEAELRAAHQQLAERVDAERRRLARGLHDGAVHHLLQISSQLDRAQERACAGGGADGADDDAAPTLATIRQEVLDVIGQLRQVVGDLRPVGLDEFGLPAVLDGYVARLRREGRIDPPTIDLAVDPATADLPPSLAHCLFQVAREALRNAVRHAQARHIRLELQQEADTLVLRVRDDGVGFHVPASMYELAQAGHFGLIGIAEQVDLCRGQLTIHSQPGNGTELIVRLDSIPFT